MDPTRFDALAKALAAPGSRRRFVAGLAAGALGALGLAGSRRRRLPRRRQHLPRARQLLLRASAAPRTPPGDAGARPPPRRPRRPRHGRRAGRPAPPWTPATATPRAPAAPSRATPSAPSRAAAPPPAAPRRPAPRPRRPRRRPRRPRPRPRRRPRRRPARRPRRAPQQRRPRPRRRPRRPRPPRRRHDEHDDHHPAADAGVVPGLRLVEAVHGGGLLHAAGRGLPGDGTSAAELLASCAAGEACCGDAVCCTDRQGRQYCTAADAGDPDCGACAVECGAGLACCGGERCGLAAGAACAADADCCTGLCCGGRCGQAEGGVCAFNADCCAGVCVARPAGRPASPRAASATGRSTGSRTPRHAAGCGDGLLRRPGLRHRTTRRSGVHTRPPAARTGRRSASHRHQAPVEFSCIPMTLVWVHPRRPLHLVQARGVPRARLPHRIRLYRDHVREHGGRGRGARAAPRRAGLRLQRSMRGALQPCETRIRGQPVSRAVPGGVRNGAAGRRAPRGTLQHPGREPEYLGRHNP